MQSSQSLNILFHVSRYWPAIAGAALHTRTMIKYLEQRGHQVDVIRHFSLEETSNEFAFTHSVDQQVKDEQTDIYQISPHGLWRQPLQLLSQYHQDLRIIRPLFSYGTQQTLSQRFLQIARSHQVIHAVYTGLTPTVITAQQVAKQLKIPFILTPLPHIRTGQTLAKSLRALYDRCDKLIAMTSFEKQWLIAEGIAEDKIYVCPIGALTSVETKSNFREKYNLPGKKIVLLATQIFSRSKNILQRSVLGTLKSLKEFSTSLNI